MSTATPAPPPPRLAVVVVTYQSADHIERCLDSVGGATDEPVELVVVDNASSDATPDLVRAHPAVTKFCESPTNLGFGAGCNVGIAHTSADHVLFLNPDAQLNAAALEGLLDYLADHPDVGIVGPALEAAPGEIHRDISATGLFPSFRQALFEYTRLGRWFPRSRWVREYFLTDLDRRAIAPVAMVQGACLLTRRAVLDEVGLFDERFFLYFEETDLCRRAAAAGWRTHYVGSVSVTHAGSQSSADQRPDGREFIRSMYLFHHKHYGLLSAIGLWLILAPYHLLKTVRMRIESWRRPDDPHLARDTQTVAERCAAHFTLLGPR